MIKFQRRDQIPLHSALIPAEALKCASIQKELKHAAKAERVDKVGVRARKAIDRLVSPGVVVVAGSIVLNRLQVGLELQQGLLKGWNASHAPLQICNLTYELAFEAPAGLYGSLHLTAEADVILRIFS